MVRHSQAVNSISLRLESLEAREVPAALIAQERTVLEVPAAPIAQERGSLPDSASTAAATVTNAPPVQTVDSNATATEHSEGSVGLPLRAVPRSRFAVSSGPGGTTQVNVYDSATNAMLGIITPFGRDFTYGARVATGDLTGDDIEDIVVAAAAGSSPWVKIYDGGTLAEIRTFLAYGFSFTGGLFVATGDFDADGRKDIVTGAGAGGGPHIQVFNGKDLFPTTGRASSVPNASQSYFAYAPTFLGGVSVATADIDGDGRSDVITGAGPGGGPHVQVFSGKDHKSLASFFAYEPTMTLGILVTAGDLTGDGKAEIATAPMLGGAPIARSFTPAGKAVADYIPFGTDSRNGASVSAQDVDGDGIAELILATGTKTPPQVRVLSGKTGQTMREFPAFVPDYSGGLYVG